MEETSPLPDDVLELGRSLIPRPAFLVGCARSGTSILGEAIAQHPRVAYLFEASPIWNRLAPPRPDHRLTAADAAPEAAAAIYRALAGERAALAGDVLVEKNPKHVIRIPFLAALFPEARFLHLLRDGRDTVASLMFRNRGERWGHLEIPGWRDLLARYPRENHVRCAHQWRDAVRIARADATALPAGRYAEVRYEDLVSRPGAVMARVLGFLELEPDPAVDAFLARIQDETAGSYHAKKQVRHYVENHARRVGRHRENLTAAELRDVEAVCGDLLRELGYA
jgi:hypothetical protein